MFTDYYRLIGITIDIIIFSINWEFFFNLLILVICINDSHYLFSISRILSLPIVFFTVSFIGKKKLVDSKHYQ